MNRVERRVFSAEADFRSAVADYLYQTTKDALAARGKALIALSGGSSPFPIYREFSDRQLAWGQVSIVPVDERLEDADAGASNYRSLAALFVRTGAQSVPLWQAEIALSEAGDFAQGQLARFGNSPDLVSLGMGADGHFASIFPGPDIETAFAPGGDVSAVRVRPDPLPPEAPFERITMSVPYIERSGSVILVIAGEAKRRVLDAALAQGAGSSLPIGRFLAGLKRSIITFEGP